MADPVDPSMIPSCCPIVYMYKRAATEKLKKIEIEINTLRTGAAKHGIADLISLIIG
jgi:hypothetical protein